MPPLVGTPSLDCGLILNSFDSLRAASPNCWSGGSSETTVQLVSLPLDSTPQLIAEGREAFRRDLPDLLKRYPGQWVAYSGSRRLGIGRTKTRLYQECLSSGLKRGEFIVLTVEAEYDNEVDLPLDV